MSIHPEERYQEITVRLWGKGLVQRRVAIGTEIGASSRIAVHARQFVISRIDARNGASGLVPDELEGAVVSNDFPVFTPHPDRLLPEFLGWYSKTSGFVELCRTASEGTTNRVRLKEDRFLATMIPLPPLTEQRRLVSIVDSLSAKIEEARRQKKRSIKATSSLISSRSLQIFRELESKYPIKSFAELKPHVTSGPRNWGQRTVASGERFYRAQDVLPQGRLATTGKVFIEAPDLNQGAGAKLKPGDLMMVITGATVGRVAVYPPDIEPGYVSQHVAICRFGSDELTPEYALHGLLSPFGQDQLLGQRYGQGKPGLNLTNLRNLRLPIPPKIEQYRVVEYLELLGAKAEELKSLQSSSSLEIETFLPAVLGRVFRGQI